MVGTPIFMEACRKIEELGGEDWFFEELSAVGNVSKFAKQIDISRDLLYKWRRKGGEERKRKWDEAMREGAEVWLDEADEIMDDMPLRGNLPADVTARVGKAKYAHERAKMLDPERFDRAAAAATNIGELLLSALQARGTAAVIKASEPMQLMPAEIVEEE